MRGEIHQLIDFCQTNFEFKNLSTELFQCHHRKLAFNSDTYSIQRVEIQFNDEQNPPVNK